MERAVLLMGLALTSTFAFIPKTPATLTESTIRPARNGGPGGNDQPELASTSKRPLFRPDQLPAAQSVARLATPPPQDTALLKLTTILFVNGHRDKANREVLVGDDGSNRYRLHVVSNRLRALEINGAAVPAQELNRYEPLRRQVELALNQMKQRPGSQAPAYAKAKQTQAQAPHSPAGLDDQQRLRGVLAALVAAQVITKTANVVWFGLSTEELVVNDQKQPEALRQQLAAEYGIKARYGLYYGPVKMIGTGVFLDESDL